MCEARVPSKHPRRVIKTIVDDVLPSLDWGMIT
jgi:hypothetical protein